MRLLIFGLVILLGCGVQRPETRNDLVALIGRLPTIQTPVTFDSDKPVSVGVKIDQDVIDSLQIKIPGYGILGKLFETDDFIAIVGIVPNDTGSPQILIFDTTGKEIDSYLAYGTAGADMGFNSKNVVTINPNREILFIDSTWTMKINDERTDIIEGTDSLSVTTEQFRITDAGTIEKIR
jgi:hypothetical protein